MGYFRLRQKGSARAGLPLLTAALAAACACLFAGPAPARAAAPLSFFDAPHELRGQLGSAGREAALDELDALGVDVVRMIVYWSEVSPNPNSPTRPAQLEPRNHTTYGSNGRLWGDIDAVVRGAAARGMQVALVPSGKFPSGVVPKWVSSDPSNTVSDPNPAAFEDFMYALGSRYNGFYRPTPESPPIPRAQFISAWNEPNSDLFLGPRKRYGRLYVPELYRRLVFAARRGLSDAGWDGTFLVGETAPRRSIHAIAPIDLMRGALCLNSRYKPVGPCSRLPGDGWSHHPYGRALMPQRRPKDPTQITAANLGKLTKALDRAASAGMIRSRIPLWITEFGVESQRGRSPAAQAAGLATAERIIGSNKRVRSVAQYLLRDDPPERWGVFSGLRTHKSPVGAGCKGCKPAFGSYRTPLAVRAFGPRRCLKRKQNRKTGKRRCVRRSSGRRVSVWGHVRPVRSRATVVVWFRDRGRKPRRLKRLRTDGSGYFTFKSKNRPLRKWRLAWNGQRGPWVSAFRY